MAYKGFPPKILFCGCSHDYQDRKFGAGRRYHNACKGGTNEANYRCTVCAAVKQGDK